MKKYLFSLILLIGTLNIGNALERVTVGLFYPAGGTPSVDIQVHDLDAGTSLQYSENIGLVSTNTSGIALFTFGDGIAAWQTIPASNIDGKWVVNVLVNSTLYAQYRLDKLIMEQPFHEVNVQIDGDLDLGGDNILNVDTITGGGNGVTINDDLNVIGELLISNHLHVSYDATTQTLINGSQINIGSSTLVRCITSNANVTGITLENGTQDGQLVIISNEDSGQISFANPVANMFHPGHNIKQNHAHFFIWNGSKWMAVVDQ